MELALAGKLGRKYLIQGEMARVWLVFDKGFIFHFSFFLSFLLTLD